MQTNEIENSQRKQNYRRALFYAYAAYEGEKDVDTLPVLAEAIARLINFPEDVAQAIIGEFAEKLEISSFSEAKEKAQQAIEAARAKRREREKDH